MDTNRIIELLKEQGQIILQGAPGTGKTYATVELAVALCCPKDYISIGDNHNKLKEKYNELVKNGRVAFTTFHQSMDYEDFVEGYKPATEEERKNDQNTQFVLRDGIFKEICQKARYKKAKKEVIVKDNNNGEYILISIDSSKVTYGSFNTIAKNAVENEWNNNNNKGKYERPNGKRPGNTIAENICEKLQNDYSGNFGDRWEALLNDIYACSQFSAGKYKLLPFINKDQIRSYSEATCTIKNLRNKYGNQKDAKGIENAIIAKLNNYSASAFEDVLNELKSEMEEEEPQPYLLIIDEINRANISKVMGELITLLEKGKREGNEEDARSAKLPYSQEEFTVPDNLYIIGTMNTADRSLGSIDYAIRRRFAFVTLESEEKLVVKEYKDYFKNVKSLIKECRDDDFEVDEIMVGHSYFMPKNDDEWNRNIDYKIIPLLLEYFKDGVLIDKENKIFIDRNKTKKDQLKSYIKSYKNQQNDQKNKDQQQNEQEIASE